MRIGHNENNFNYSTLRKARGLFQFKSAGKTLFFWTF